MQLCYTSGRFSAPSVPGTISSLFRLQTDFVIGSSYCIRIRIKGMACHDDYIAFLQRNLPRLGYRWAGFRKPRGQVIKRIARRIESLELQGVREYEAYLHSNADEWKQFDNLCRITISMFYRDRRVFEDIRDDVLPSLAQLAVSRGQAHISCLCAGCCSGEEPYTLKIVWELAVRPQVSGPLKLQITAIDSNQELLDRASAGLYAPGSLKDLPQQYKDQAFGLTSGGYVLKERFRQGIEFIKSDIRHDLVDNGPFDLILCRNLAFTYFDDESQAGVLDKLVSILRPGGFLVIGVHERLPDRDHGLVIHSSGHASSKCIYRKPVKNP